jgi:hypothetical protein
MGRGRKAMRERRKGGAGPRRFYRMIGMLMLSEAVRRGVEVMALPTGSDVNQPPIVNCVRELRLAREAT